MRIVAGEARGRRIASVEGVDVRPTMDRVREAIFNSLTSHGLVEDRVMADLFAGSGALGLEALSRGAARVVFADSDRRAVAVVEANLATFGFADRAHVHRGDGVALARTLDGIDVALCDPPYAFDAWPALLEVLAERGVEAVVVESDRAVEPGEQWDVLKQQRYAGTVVTIARRGDGARPMRGGAPADQEDNPT
jgi:16S rRNA (guanine966-N2)-methyltransferase